MAQVSNRFFVTAIKDGQVASGYMRCNTTLQQFYDKDTQTCVPDWRPGKQKQGEVQPVITAYTRLGGQSKAPFSNKWVWNGYVDEGGYGIFLADGSCRYNYTMDGVSYPLFIRGTDANGRPTLTINGNLAGYGAQPGVEPVIDQDVISNIGTIEANGGQLDYAMDIAVRLSYLVATNGYWGNISFDGNSVITSPDITSPDGKVKLDCHLYLGTAPQAAADFNTKWYIEGDSTVKSTQKSYTLTANDVVDNVTVRCDFYSLANELLCSAYIEVDDAQDDDEMQITHPGGQSSANLRTGESVTFTTWMSSRTDATQVKTAYNRYRVKILNSNSDVITDQVAPQSAIIVDGYWEITTVGGNNDAEYLRGKSIGKVTIDYDVVAAEGNGDAVSGVIIADHYVPQT